MRAVVWAAVGLGLVAPMRAEPPETKLVISLTAEGKSLPVATDFRLPSDARNLVFVINGRRDGRTVSCGRVRYKLQGYDADWRELGADMSLNVQFMDPAGVLRTQSIPVVGTSAGWKGDLEGSHFTHRREELAAPPGASLLNVLISSAGPSSSMGVFAVRNLVLERTSPDGIVTREPLMSAGDDSGAKPPGWEQGGTRPTMAKTRLADGASDIFYVEDDDPASYAEWHLVSADVRPIEEGERLALEWEQTYSIGYGEVSKAYYERLPPGHYQFRINKLDFTGRPLAYETAVDLEVSPPLWRNSWFWLAVLVPVLVILGIVWRKAHEAKARRHIEWLRQQHLVETERLRIARDIHDDLGVRLTHISLVSDMAEDEVGDVAAARAEFSRISNMARDLVSALYETVWTVDPKNDYLQALIDFLCEITEKLCESANIRCVIDACEVDEKIQISSEWRHSVSMAVKEAVHNAIRHARTPEIAVKITCERDVLVIEVRDRGIGFPAGSAEGHGLENMRHRMQSLGGRIEIRSDDGTLIRFEVPLAKDQPGAPEPAPAFS